MIKFLFLALLLGSYNQTISQVTKVELYNLVKRLIPDSTGHENVGNWAVRNPKVYPVKWNANKIEMSDDTSINFFRQGIADIMIRGKRMFAFGSPITWSVKLKGPKMGYTSFTIISAPIHELFTAINIDSMFGIKPYTATLLKSCATNPSTGFKYYQVKIPRKDIFYLKLSWFTMNGKTTLRIDGYSESGKSAVKLGCIL